MGSRASRGGREGFRAEPAAAPFPAASATGIVKVNCVPWPSPPLSAQMRPPVGFHQALADEESQAGPPEPALRLAAEARILLEKLRQQLRRHAPCLRQRPRLQRARHRTPRRPGWATTGESAWKRWRRGCSGPGRCVCRSAITRGRSGGRSMRTVCLLPPLRNVFLAWSTRSAHLRGPRGRPTACPCRCDPHPAGR